MKIFICIDDTDNVESKGTGEIASEIVELIESFNWGTCEKITRHQLLVHPDIPYTSHNSSMCFTVDINKSDLNRVIETAMKVLETESAVGSDPGLCVFVPETLTQHQHQQLIDFGYKAKREVLTKEDAYHLADVLSIHLSEHGGTGQGVVGALAGVGLRLTGNDGRFKGKHKLKEDNKVVSVKDILDETSIEIVRTEKGLILHEMEQVEIEDKLKSVFLNHQSVLLVDSVERNGKMTWVPCSGSTLKKY